MFSLYNSIKYILFPFFCLKTECVVKVVLNTQILIIKVQILINLMGRGPKHVIIYVWGGHNLVLYLLLKDLLFDYLDFNLHNYQNLVSLVYLCRQ